MVSGILEVLDGCFTLVGNNTDEMKHQPKTLAIEVATMLLILPTPSSVQHHTKSLLCALHSSKAAYHNYKVIKTKHVTLTFLFDFFPLNVEGSLHL